MFYDTRKNDHGLPHNPFKAIVAPRPIGWITSMSAKGEINLAPYSFFNGITDKPPIVMFSSEGAKDSVAFVEETKEFVCSLATFDLRDQMNGTSAPLPRGAMRDEGDRPRGRAVAAGQAAAGRRLALRAGMQMAPDRAAQGHRRPAARTLRGVRPGRSASTSTTASSRTAGSTPPR